MDLPGLPARIRVAMLDDVPVIAAMIRDLAAYEREPERARASDDQLAEALFGDDAVASALLAHLDDVPVGFALWYRSFSTWEGVAGLYLEDLWVAEEHRGSGLGRDLLTALARIAGHHGWTRVEWSVLRWNTPSIAFYDGLGATPLDDWLTYRLEGDALRDVASDSMR